MVVRFFILIASTVMQNPAAVSRFPLQPSGFRCNRGYAQLQRIIQLLFALHFYYRYNHLLQAYASMLKSIPVIIHIMVIIIGIT